MKTLEDVKNVNDAALLIEHLAREVGRLSESGAADIQEAQRVADMLTRTQLMLNELERVEVVARGISREMVERFTVLEGRIRLIRNELCRTQRGNGAETPPGAG